MYHPASLGETWESVEICNSGASTVYLAGHVLDDNNAIAHVSANIADGIIAPDAAAILYNVEEVTAIDFVAAWGPDVNFVPTINWSDGLLNNGSDQVGLWHCFTS
ncbi:MAG: hypothetical protein ACI9P5_004713 [Saprospiraceae bacterium]|jgi:hypothetical protein